jgi:hypothetical protein
MTCSAPARVPQKTDDTRRTGPAPNKIGDGLAALGYDAMSENRMRWTPCLIALLLASCYMPPEIYPNPPIDPDLPESPDAPVYSVILTTDATNNAFIARPIPRPQDGEPRDMDIEIYVTARLAELSASLTFSRAFEVVNVPEDRETRIRYRVVQYTQFGRTVRESYDYFVEQAPFEVLGTETEEWSYMSPDEGGWRSRVRLRFRSDHPDWKFSDATIHVHFEGDRTEAVPLFAP